MHNTKIKYKLNSRLVLLNPPESLIDDFAQYALMFPHGLLSQLAEKAVIRAFLD